MPDLENTKALAVLLQGRRVGIINRLAGDRVLFAFEQDYVDDPNRPTLSLSFKGQGGRVVTSTRSYVGRVPPFFANLLPEGNLRTYLASHVGIKPEREFPLLAALGADLPGGLVVTPLTDEGEPNDRGDEAEIDEPQRSEVSRFRFSLAGVQLKLSALLEATGKLTIPAGGLGGEWIVKLPSPQFPSLPENEYVMLELARAIGIPVPHIRLVPVGEIQGLPKDMGPFTGHALAVERFDRGPGGKRTHMEDFAQVFGLYPDRKYEKRSYANIAEVLWAETGEEGTYDFVRRLVFSVVIGNGDMHLKNWSLLYPDGRTPVLSPAYDFVSTLPYIETDELALSFGDSTRLDGVTRDQVRRLAEKAGLAVTPLSEIVAETVDRTVDAWKTLGQRDLLPAELRAQIECQIEEAASKTDR